MSKRKRKNALQFTKQEAAPASGQTKPTGRDKKIAGLEKKSDKLGQKLDKANAKLPAKKKIQRQRIYDEQKKKVKSKLNFSKDPIPQNQAKWNQPLTRSAPRKATGAALSTGVTKLHGKVYESEGENVGVHAGHRAELVGESAARSGKRAARSAYRSVRNAPYRKTAKLEAKAAKNQGKLQFHKAMKENPNLKGNAASKAFQKRAIKRDYAKAYRTAKKTGTTVKRGATAVQKSTQAVTAAIRKNPILIVKLAILGLIIVLIMCLLSMCGLFGGGSTYTVTTMYTAADRDISDAEVYYTQKEADLQKQVSNAEANNQGYDEYRYDLGAGIGHDPYVLLAFLTAVYDKFTVDQVKPVIDQLYTAQYTLTFTPSTETRYRTETQTTTSTDPVTGNVTTTTEDVQVPYDWHVLTITLTVTPLDQIVAPMMDETQTQHSAILIQSEGGRAYAGNPVNFDWLADVTKGYGYWYNTATGTTDFNAGVDVAVPQGTTVNAGFDGTVVSAGYDATYGNSVCIVNSRNIYVRYAQLSTISVTMGQSVSSGSVLGTTGTTLHLEVQDYDGATLDPLLFISTGHAGATSGISN